MLHKFAFVRFVCTLGEISEVLVCCCCVFLHRFLSLSIVWSQHLGEKETNDSLYTKTITKTNSSESKTKTPEKFSSSVSNSKLVKLHT